MKKTLVFNHTHPPTICPTQGHNNYVRSLATTLDGKSVLSSDDDGVVLVFDLASGLLQRNFTVSASEVRVWLRSVCMMDLQLIGHIGFNGLRACSFSCSLVPVWVESPLLSVQDHE